MSQRQPVLVVFLRHFGCTFCREALAELRRQRHAIERDGTRIALVHMGSEAGAREFLQRYRLADVAHVSDPGCRLYRALQLGRGSFGQLFGPRVLARSVEAGIVGGHGLGSLQGDGFQMPGAFLVHRGELVRAFRHAHVAERPDYRALATLPPLFDAKSQGDAREETHPTGMENAHAYR